MKMAMAMGKIDTTTTNASINNNAKDRPMPLRNGKHATKTNHLHSAGMTLATTATKGDHMALDNHDKTTLPTAQM